MAEAASEGVIVPYPAETAAVRHLSLLDRVNIVKERNGVFDAYVPLHLIYREEVPVDEEHVLEISSSMGQEAQAPEGGTGQLSPILIAHIPEEPKFPIVDGFHRTDSLYKRGEEEAYATIRPNSTWERVFDLRILTATTHRSVRFARVVEWVNQVWAISPWADRIDVTKAFAIATTPNYKGAQAGLTPQDVKDIRTWVGEKCGQWKLSSAAIYKSLYTANALAPDILKEIREGQKGRGVQNVINQQQATHISSVLPHKHDIQRVVASAVKERGLSATETLLVAEKVKDAETAGQALEIINSASMHAVVSNAKKAKASKTSKDVNKISGKSNEALIIDGLKMAQMALELMVLRGGHIPAPLNRYTKNESNDADAIQVWPTVWTEERIDEVLDVLEKVGSELQQSLITKNGFDEVTSELVCRHAGSRLIADIRGGLLRYVDVEHTNLRQIYIAAARDEATRSRALDNGKIELPGADITFTLMRALRSTGKSPAEIANIIKAYLPEIDAPQRQVTLLSGVMGLSSYVVARVIGSDEVLVASTVRDLAAELAHIAPNASSSTSSLGKIQAGVNVDLSKREESLPLPSSGEANGATLTPRELEILRYAQIGLTNKRIAAVVSVTEQTVKFHLSNLYSKLGVENRTQAVQFATQQGLLAATEE